MTKSVRRMRLDEAALENADLLLFRGSGLIAKLIRVAGRTVYSHAAKVVFWEGEPYVCEMREWIGGRAVTLESQVAQYPARIDWYKTNPHCLPRYERLASARFSRRMAGRRYGYGAVLLSALLHLPVVRWFWRPNLADESVGKRPPYCSSACSMADRVAGGFDPVPQLADAYVEPGDLARSNFYRYMGTLVL